MRPGRPGAATRLITSATGPMLAEATAAGISRLVRAGFGPDDDDEPSGLAVGGHRGPVAVAEADAEAADRHLDRLDDQLDAYFTGRLREFDVPVDWAATGVHDEFSREVYREIQAVPYGETASYGQVSIDAGRPRNARRVGRLCSLVPVSFLIPVHRITRADGGLGGSPDYRRRLLEHEQRNLDSSGPVAITPV